MQVEPESRPDGDKLPVRPARDLPSAFESPRLMCRVPQPADVSALVHYACAHLGAVRLEAIVDESNRRSRRVVEANGFTLEGILRWHRRRPDGALRDLCIYARLADVQRRCAGVVPWSPS